VELTFAADNSYLCSNV